MLSPSVLVRVAFVAISVCGMALGAEPVRPDSSRSENSRAELERAVRSYERAFNDGNPDAVARLWSSDCVYENRDTGERITRRDAVREDMFALFKAEPQGRLAIDIERIRLIQPDVARVDGTSEVSREGRPAQRARFSAIYVRENGRWLLDSVEEFSPRSPQSAEAALSQLEWMIGRWVDQSDEMEVQTDVRWAPGGSFLIRSYSIDTGEASHRGTQVIGWDPIREQIRSWVFDSDGAFGEGVWAKSGDQWFVRNTFTTGGGDLVSGTQIITRTGDGRLKVQTVGQEFNGQPQPSKEPITVVRINEAPTGQAPPVPQGVQR